VYATPHVRDSCGVKWRGGWVVGPAASVVALAGAFSACDDGDQSTFTRTSVEGGPTEDAPFDAPSIADATADVVGDGGDADASSAAPRGQIATGSSDDPAATYGYGDHTCAIAGAERSLYCWGANDRGQLGAGTTGAGVLLTSDISAATKIAVDETGLPFSGVDEVTASGFHSCARKGDTLFCWGEKFTGSQAEPPADPATDRTKPRAIGNLAIEALAAGGPHTCTLKANGKIVCFGHSYFNELGRARAMDPTCTAPFFYAYAGMVDPHQCSGDLLEMASNVVSASALAGGEIHSCALAAGSVFCWGSNFYGQLGVTGTVSDLNPQRVLTDLVASTPLDGVTEIASGGGKHTCALRTGKVFCWGSNSSGQLGADPTAITQRPNAVAVPGIDDATAIGAADGISCAVRTGGSVWCWGAADLGQLGDAGAIDGGVASPTPRQILGPAGAGTLAGVRAVAPGKRHVCAQKTDETVWCWGKNDRGQLGNGTTTDSIYPVKVTGIP